MARKKHWSVESVFDDSVMNPDMTIPPRPTGSPVAIQLRQSCERLRKHREQQKQGTETETE